MAENSEVVNLNQHPDLPDGHEDELDASGPDGDRIHEHDADGDEEGDVVFVEHGSAGHLWGVLLVLPLLFEVEVLLVVDSVVFAEEVH